VLRLKNVWRHTSTLSYIFSVWWLVKHREKFTFLHLPYLLINHLFSCHTSFCDFLYHISYIMLDNKWWYGCECVLFRVERKPSWSTVRYYPIIIQEGLRKFTEISHNIQSYSRHLKPKLSQYEVEVSITMPCHTLRSYIMKVNVLQHGYLVVHGSVSWDRTVMRFFIDAEMEPFHIKILNFASYSV
jgi:hypothetical protein